MLLIRARDHGTGGLWRTCRRIQLLDRTATLIPLQTRVPMRTVVPILLAALARRLIERATVSVLVRTRPGTTSVAAVTVLGIATVSLPTPAFCSER